MEMVVNSLRWKTIVKNCKNQNRTHFLIIVLLPKLSLTKVRTPVTNRLEGSNKCHQVGAVKEKIQRILSKNLRCDKS